MADIKPIKLYSHIGGPNPWKVAIILEELGLPYDTEFVDFKVVKQEPYISVNPNGRVPAIDDPNTGITIWESGAIIQYLITTYDTTNKISYPYKSKDQFLSDQWLHFQMSGQGPYFGQFAWFSFYHPEKIASAQERYKNEIIRVVGVIDLHLERTGSEYLVGDKCTYADLSFIPWGLGIDRFGIDIYDDGKKNQKYKAWWDRITGREKVQKVLKAKDDAAKQGH